MLKNYFLTAIRHLLRQRVFSLITILGLSIAITISILLYLFVQHELSYDKFNANYDSIYRVVSRFTDNKGQPHQYAISLGMLAPELQEQFPEIQNTVRLYYSRHREVEHDKQRFGDLQMYYADSAFFQMFTYETVAGTLQNSLQQKAQAVISHELAQKLYGTENPVGQTFWLEDQLFTVAGVVEVPANTHLPFDAVFSIESFQHLETFVKDGGLEFITYYQLKSGVDKTEVTTKIKAFYDEMLNKRFARMDVKADNYMQPLSRVHLYSGGISSTAISGDIQTVYIVIFLSFFILLIAIINFVNLITARSESRSKEIGLRKVVGAHRSDLITQFIGEAILVVFIAFVLALFFVELLLGQFGQLLNRELTSVYWNEWLMLAGFVVFIVFIGSVAGFYPALYLSRFRAVRILKGGTSTGKRLNPMTKILVVLQFSIAILLITNLLFLNQQISYMKNKSLGFDKEQIVVVPNISAKLSESGEAIGNELRKLPAVIDVSATQGVPGGGFSGQNIHIEGEAPESGIMINENRTFYGFVSTFGLELLHGRDFSPDRLSDQQAFILNETAVKQLFPENPNPVGQRLVLSNRQGELIGVVKDFHYSSLRTKIEPFVISLDPPFRLVLAVKIKTGNTSQTLDDIENVLKKFDSAYRFDYYFLDEAFDKMYRNEERNTRLITYSALLAIVLSMVGLLALSLLVVVRRTKEIAVRKVLGASMSNIISILTRDVVKWVAVANVIALPLSYWLITKWLQNFAYTISIAAHWWIFVVSAVLSVAVALLTILYQVIKAASANPVDALIYE